MHVLGRGVSSNLMRLSSGYCHLLTRKLRMYSRSCPVGILFSELAVLRYYPLAIILLTSRHITKIESPSMKLTRIVHGLQLMSSKLTLQIPTTDLRSGSASPHPFKYSSFGEVIVKSISKMSQNLTVSLNPSIDRGAPRS